MLACRRATDDHHSISGGAINQYGSCALRAEGPELLGAAMQGPSRYFTVHHKSAVSIKWNHLVSSAPPPGIMYFVWTPSDRRICIPSGCIMWVGWGGRGLRGAGGQPGFTVAAGKTSNLHSSPLRPSRGNNLFGRIVSEILPAARGASRHL